MRSSSRHSERGSKFQSESARHSESTRELSERLDTLMSERFSMTELEPEEPSFSRGGESTMVGVQRLDEGSHFGEENFLLEQPYTFDVRTLKLCESLLLPRSAFSDLMQRFPDQSDLIRRTARKLHRRNVRADAAVLQNLQSLKVGKITGRIVNLASLPPLQRGVSNAGSTTSLPLSVLRRTSRRQSVEEKEKQQAEDGPAVIE
eukprot:2019066-Prymnesium_polylepis.1